MAENGRPKIHLTLAINDSDQVRDVITGQVPVVGIDLTCLLFEVEEIFFRFTHHREWEVSELSFAKYCSLRAQGDESVIAIPVFPSRSFRHSAIYVRHDGPVDDPQALRGARIGFPEWTVTATVYARALLQHEYGVELSDVRWVQGGTNEAGRVETLPVQLPDGIEVRPERQSSLNDLLIAGEIDAIIAPHPPTGYTDGSGQIVRLFSDSPAAEEAYFKRTGIFPIMHVLVLRADVHERYPWAAANLFTAFEDAKQRSLARMLDANAPRTPVPWAAAHAQRAVSVFGPDLWPYGLEANRTTIEAFLDYAVEQGVCQRRLEPDELFAPQVREFFRV
jgi:4,5-dihydroxyphthalate decarboxylase